jgi:hypothetical protein
VRLRYFTPVVAVIFTIALVHPLAPSFATTAATSRSIRHTVNGVAFSVAPEYSRVQVDEASEDVVILYDAQLQALLFVAAPEKANDPKVVGAAQKLAARVIAGESAKPFSWRRMFSPSAYNRYDRQRGEYWGYDGKTLICFESHRLAFSSRTVHVGYAYLIAEGAQARKDMRVGLASMTETVTIEYAKRIARSITRAETGS